MERMTFGLYLIFAILYATMNISYSLPKINSAAPDFTDANVLMPDKSFGKISLSDFKGKWVLLFFYPLDFTFVCPTEIIDFSDMSVEFNKINTQVIGASVDSLYSHFHWCKTPRKEGGLGDIKIPLIADLNRKISNDYGVLLNDEGHTCRGTFIIDPKGNLRHFAFNDPPVGRNVAEFLRLVQAYQFADKNGEVCPAKWKPGGKTIKPDVEGSLEYFAEVSQETERDL